MNICTHKSRCVVSQLHDLLFVKVKLLKVFSSSNEPNTCTIIILATFMYSLSFKTRRGKDWTFNHIQMIGFREPMRQFKTQLCCSLWTCRLHCVEHFNFMRVVHMNVNTLNTSMMMEHILLITNIECQISKQLKFASFSCATQMKGNCPQWWCSQITMNSKKAKSSYLQKMSTYNQYFSLY